MTFENKYITGVLKMDGKLPSFKKAVKTGNDSSIEMLQEQMKRIGFAECKFIMKDNSGSTGDYASLSSNDIIMISRGKYPLKTHGKLFSELIGQRCKYGNSCRSSSCLFSHSADWEDEMEHYRIIVALIVQSWPKNKFISKSEQFSKSRI